VHDHRRVAPGRVHDAGVWRLRREKIVAVDGTSLTVTRADRESFEVALIPHTLDRTVAGGYRAGTRVNLEVDLVARYVARLMAVSGGRT
jgi:riboflavin synthase alpha subunit